MTKLRVTLEGKAYEVVVEMIEDSPKSSVPVAPVPFRETAAMSFGPPQHVLVAPPKVPDSGADDPGAVVCPLGGKVVSVDVKIGQAVAEGDQVATIEAMKMNTFVFSPVAGKVVVIEASSGDMVEEGAILLRVG